MTKTERFGMLLSRTEKAALRALSARERISSAAVVRRLIWREAEYRGLVTTVSASNPRSGVEGADNGAE